MNLYTQSIEDATVTITNGGTGSNSKLLQDRDDRTLGLNAGAAATTITLHMDFGAAISVDYITLGSLTTSDEVDWTWDYSDNDSDWTTVDSDTGMTFTGTHFHVGTTSVSHRYWRFTMDRSTASPTAICSFIFTGSTYTFPVDYKYNNNRTTFQRTESMSDIYGYPYGQAINTSKKYIWDVVFNLTKTQVGSLETQLEYCDYNLKPMILYDTNIDTSRHLVRFINNALNTSNLAYDYYEVPLRFEEL